MKFLKKLFKPKPKYKKGKPAKIEIKLDRRGNQIYYKSHDTGYEEWREYDDHNNCIHFKNNEGLEYWNDYDEDGNVIHHKDESGYEYYDEYDEHHNLISHKRV